MISQLTIILTFLTNSIFECTEVDILKKNSITEKKLNFYEDFEIVKKRSICIKKCNNWPQPIPYNIGSWLNANAIKKAINLISTSTCITFSEAPSRPLGNYGISFIYDKSKCASNLGFKRTNNFLKVYLTPECSGSIGTVQHEVSHALKVIHQHNRFDRNYYINIHLNNFSDENYKKRANEIKRNEFSTFNVSYDYASVMHYGRKAAAKENTNTFTAKNIEPYTYMMGQREEMTFNDVKLLNLNYCLERCKNSQVQCQNGAYLNWKTCADCICPKRYSGTFCDTVTPLEGTCSNVNLIATQRQTELKENGVKDCNYRIKNHDNYKIYIQIDFVNTKSADICTQGSGFEIKYLQDKGTTGLCLCGQYKNLLIISENSHVYIEYHGKENGNGFRLHYSRAIPDAYPYPTICHNEKCFEKRDEYYLPRTEN
uniref:Metalloendopeptidase n=1 Tax=Parastrongyloides trichosuri TaxID=131310 RepID=A0A0N4Z8L2_PARTI